VTDSGVINLPLPDRAARDRIASDLNTNLLVEAGAGSGKTTALVGRMVALVVSGTATVDQIAAVTFTRKAAGELRERFQAGIEDRIREERAADEPDATSLERLGTALDEIDRAFIGTIHSFCGRLLRERPLEVGLDPGFRELPVEERAGLHRQFWDSYLERQARDSDPRLEGVVKAGVSVSSLLGLFSHLVENPDVVFPAEHEAPPSMSEVGDVRAELEDLVSVGRELMDDVPQPGRKWDSLQTKIRKLHFERDITGWDEPHDVFEAIALLCKRGPNGHKTTYKTWRSADMAKALTQRINTFGVGDTPAQRLVDRWYAHRYALVIRLVRHAAEEFAAYRLRMGLLDFQDLLVLAARLLRTNPDVRRQLGNRYRRLLVDEFQDTDPLQAEIMMLLSSDAHRPSEEGDTPTSAEHEPPFDADWRAAIPRPGALFVVGDPKQSIYRFRRADIQLYGFVKDRFADFGDVVALSTNFRSRPPIGDLVNAVFSDPTFFPEESTSEQAAFERLDTRPAVESVAAEGVFCYDIAPPSKSKGAAAFDDAARIATWIRDRIDRGERSAGDFLILTRGRGQLAAYARALGQYALPVQVTGAGIGVEDELRELQVLLDCMIDPTNPVKVVAALVGLFFGIDYDRLVEHRLEGGAFDAMKPGSHGHAEVIDAIRKLHGWWRASTADPADVFIGRLVTELGLLPHAAAGELGELRAGAMLYALDTVRSATLKGEASLPGALRALEAALDLKEAEAPFEPGRPDAVRLMNLHQAKGLEGTVVILADPTDWRDRAPELHLTRREDGVAEGFLRVVAESAGGYRQAQDLARPLGWSEYEIAEKRFDAAEEVRLLYVAATRAREELVVARWPGGKGTSPWTSFDGWLDEHGERLELDVRPPEAREDVQATPEEVTRAVSEAKARLETLGAPTWSRTTVTDVAKADVRGPGSGSRPPPGSREGQRGFTWGSAVHGALAFATSGAGDDALRTACRDLLIEHQRPLDDHGEPVELKELIGLVVTVRESPLWARARASSRVLAEVSFSVPGSPPKPEVEARPSRESNASRARKQLDLFGLLDQPGPANAAAGAAAAAEGNQDPPGGDGEVPHRKEEAEAQGETVVLEGVVDLAFREDDGWVIADYKTDVGTDPDFAAREESYRRQVELYADAWTRLTGESVKERILFFTAQGRTESW